MNIVTAVTNTNVLLFSPLCKCLTSFFTTFYHLAGSKCCKLSLLDHFFSFTFSVSLPPSFSTCFFHLYSSPLLWPIAPYFVILSSVLSSSLSAPYPSLPPASSPSFSGWLVDSFYCLLPAGLLSEEHPCRGQAMCGSTCRRGEPNAAESHKHLYNPIVCLLLSMLDDFLAFTHFITFFKFTSNTLV